MKLLFTIGTIALSILMLMLAQQVSALTEQEQLNQLTQQTKQKIQELNDLFAKINACKDLAQDKNNAKVDPVVRDCIKKNTTWTDADIDLVFGPSPFPFTSAAIKAAQSSSNSTSNTSAPFSTPPQLSSSTPPQLQLLGMNSFYDNNQYNPALHIVGEVLNYGTQMATFVSVSTTLYDANNQVVGIGHSYTTPSTIMPGKKAPFETVVYRDNIKGGDFRNVHHFSLQPG